MYSFDDFVTVRTACNLFIGFSRCQVMIDRAVPLAERPGQPDSGGDKLLGLLDGNRQRLSLGEKGRNGRGIGAAGAVGIAGEDPLGSEDGDSRCRQRGYRWHTRRSRCPPLSSTLAAPMACRSRAACSISASS